MISMKIGRTRNWMAIGLTGLAALFMISAQTSRAQDADAPGFGPQEHLSGVLFSNWENLVFFVCKSSDTACADWGEGEAYSLDCAPGACDALFNGLEQSKHSPDGLVYMTVVLDGSRSLTKSKPIYLGDPGQSIRVHAVNHYEVRRQP
ncbi:hypothetical protein [Asticcacaulis solisilvae]|uniref:hypothetical protein n=1 Tax=Asticcacaulis solisilvae TaxID=1217274 RepID=UPI003FD78969